MHHRHDRFYPNTLYAMDRARKEQYGGECMDNL